MTRPPRFARFSQAEVRLLIEELDTDGNGNIDFPDFLMVVSRKMAEVESPAACVGAFKVFDKDNNGFVTVAEFRHIMTNIGDERLPDDEVDEMIKVTDACQRLRFVPCPHRCRVAVMCACSWRMWTKPGK